MALRKPTNLVVPRNLMLPKEDAKSDFMYLYTGSFVGNESTFMSKFWSSLLFPSLADNPKYGLSNKGSREFANYVRQAVPAGYLKIKKIMDAADPHFEVSLPLVSFNPTNISALADIVSKFLCDGANLEENTKNESNEFQESVAQGLNGATTVVKHEYTKEQVISAFRGLDALGKAALEKCLISMTIHSKSGLSIIYLNVKINKAEAEQLTTTQWMTIRNMDLYPLLLSWVENVYGTFGKPALASFPISKIAQTMHVATESDIRVDKFGIAIDSEGYPIFLPAELDNTSRYEDKFSEVGAHEDGSFSIYNFDKVEDEFSLGSSPSVKLPANIPVLVDWTNLKYSYTNTAGFLQVEDLSRVRKAQPQHLVSVMKDKELTDKLMMALVSLASAGGSTQEICLNSEEWATIAEAFPPAAANNRRLQELTKPQDAMTYYTGMLPFYKQMYAEPDIRIAAISEEAGSPLLRPLARWFKAAYHNIQANLDAVYSRYSISYVSNNFPWIVLVANYGDKMSDLIAEANTICSAALNQKVDPNWKMSAVPLLADEKGLLPHQDKVRNLLKDSPQFAILPVQAGGGKTPLIIIDILLEIKHGTSEPYLILCPPTLVAQYIKELVYFTNGQLNAIAVDNYTISSSGYKRLTALISNAPRNTVVVCSYDTLQEWSRTVCYGTSTETIFPVIEFLRQFRFGYAALDESQSVKNNSSRTRACMSLITDIPKKRLASGTMVHDSPSDLAMQIAMLDPTIFGSRDRFNETYGDVVKGNRVQKWKPGAEKAINNAIKTRVVVAGAMRKEWAALLPTPIELFHRVSLTPAQQALYNVIMAKTLDDIKEAAKTSKALSELVKGGGEDGPPEDEDAGEDNANLLKKYLSRIEQFITAPGKDQLAIQGYKDPEQGIEVPPLHGEDLISPKALKIVDLCRQHLEAKIPGKVLIFTNYIESAEAIYDAFPPDLKSKVILYIASDKVEAGDAFEKDPNKMIMVGVEQSLNTGLNLQFASRLIRTETVWNPGTLEQGNSRVNRPELKSKDRRENIYYDWVVADHTIDITKVSRLISKVVACAKFENADSGVYEDIETLPIIPMTLDAIRNANDWETSCRDYLVMFKQFKTAQIRDYAAYKQEHGDALLKPMSVAEPPKDAKLMYEVPYVKGLDLPKAGELGLRRLDTYMQSDPETRKWAAEVYVSKDAIHTKESLKEERQALNILRAEHRRQLENLFKGKPVHTEYGDGTISSFAMLRRVNIVLNTGETATIPRSSVFLITKPLVKVDNIRDAVLDHPKLDVVKIPELPLAEDVTPAKVGKSKVVVEKVVKKSVEENLIVELQLVVSNGFLGLSYTEDAENPDASKALQAFGFNQVPSYYYAKFSNAPRLAKQFNMWKEAGFTLDRMVQRMGVSGSIHDMYNLLKSGQVAEHVEAYKYSVKNKLANFFRMELKPSTEKKEFKPFPMILNGSAYIVLPARGQAATLGAMKVKAPGVNWKKAVPSLVFYASTPKAIKEKILAIHEAGIQISNKDELKDEFNRLRKAKYRNVTNDDLDLSKN